MHIDPRLPEIDDCLYRLAVRALIYNEGKVLLVHEKDVEWWNFPGGGIDYGESATQAIRRELSEELGVSEEHLQSDYEVAFVSVRAVVHGVPRANLFYRLDISKEHIRVGDDVLDIGWFNPDEITPEIASQCIGDHAEDVENFILTLKSLALR